MFNVLKKLNDLHNKTQILEKGYHFPFSTSQFYEIKNEYYNFLTTFHQEIRDFLDKIDNIHEPTDLDEFTHSSFDLNNLIHSFNEEIDLLEEFCVDNNFEDFLLTVQELKIDIDNIKDFKSNDDFYLSYRNKKRIFSSRINVNVNFYDINDFFANDYFIFLGKEEKKIVDEYSSLLTELELKEDELNSINSSIDDYDNDEEDYISYENLLNERETIQNDLKKIEDEIEDSKDSLFNYLEPIVIKYLKFTDVYINSDFINLIDSFINDIENIKCEVVDHYIKINNDPDFGKTYADIYLHSSPVQRIILDKQNQTKETFKFNYNKFIIFEDESYLFSENKDDFINITKEKQLKEISNKFANYFIEHFFRKHSIYSHLFKEKYKKFSKEKINIIIDCMSKFNQNLSFIEKYFDPLKDFHNTNFEKTSDLIQNKLIDVKIDNSIKSIFSNKNKHLHTKESHEELKKLILSSSLDSLKDIEKKISLFKDPKSFIEFIIKIKQELNGFSMKAYLLKMDDTSKIIFKDDSADILILRIKTFDQSKKLGTNKWCISRDSYHFYNYSQGRSQYFIYNFNKEVTDISSKIGITINSNGSYHTAHYANDTRATEDKIKELLKLIYVNDLSLNIDDKIKKKYEIDESDNLILSSKHKLKI